MFIAGYSATFKISDAKLYVLVDTLSTEDNGKLSKLLSDGFKRPLYWNKQKVIPNEREAGANNNPKNIRKLLDSSYQGVKRLLIIQLQLLVLIKPLEVNLVQIKNTSFQE